MNKSYDFPNFNPEKLHPDNIDRLAIEKVPEKSIVLDIGCATGFMGEYLVKKKKCKVFGVDIDPKEIEASKKRLSDAICLNVESEGSFQQIKKISKRFDVLLATSVIEHLIDPERFLKTYGALVKKGDLIIVTTPNIAHWSMRLSLLLGRFNYTEYGILDNTHLHFYTEKTFKDLFRNNNFEILEYKIDSVGGGYPKISSFLSRFFPRIFAYQMLIVATPKK